MTNKNLPVTTSNPNGGFLTLEAQKPEITLYKKRKKMQVLRDKS